jgi:hypothetical protein
MQRLETVWNCYRSNRLPMGQLLPRKKRGSRLLSAIILAICVACASGCTPIPEFTCWNNTGGTVVIDSDGKLHAVTNGSSESIRFPGNTMKLYIRNVSGTVWRYDAQYPSRTFIVGQKTMYFQIQPDGSIYVLTPPAKSIVTNFPVQPAGFPLRPQE